MKLRVANTCSRVKIRFISKHGLQGPGAEATDQARHLHVVNGLRYVESPFTLHTWQRGAAGTAGTSITPILWDDDDNTVKITITPPSESYITQLAAGAALFKGQHVCSECTCSRAVNWSCSHARHSD